MSPHLKPTVRMVIGSFAAGAGAMVLFGLIGPVMVQSSLSVREAMAAELAAEQQVLAPLDVAAIERQLDAAQSSVNAARASTDDDIARLARLAGR
jgi:hypothetical protein